LTSRQKVDRPMDRSDAASVSEMRSGAGFSFIKCMQIILVIRGNNAYINRMKTSQKASAPRGRGRPPLSNGAATVRVSVQVTEPQKEKLEKLGGSAWVRGRIDKAKLPKE